VNFFFFMGHSLLVIIYDFNVVGVTVFPKKT